MSLEFVFVCLFFVFKQKTAYEIRISDWSSDVCSSDLTGRTQRAIHEQACDAWREGLGTLRQPRGATMSPLRVSGEDDCWSILETDGRRRSEERRVGEACVS